MELVLNVNSLVYYVHSFSMPFQSSKHLIDSMSSSSKFYVLTWVLECSPTHVSTQTEEVE